MDTPGDPLDPLQCLLKLKRHEAPPPGYFDRLPREIMAGIREGRNKPEPGLPARLGDAAPWLLRLLEKLTARPAFAGFAGASACAVLIGLIALAGKPDAGGGATVRPAGLTELPGAGNADIAATSSAGPLRIPSPNEVAPPPRNLFEMMPTGQTLPAGFNPAGN